MPFRFGIATLTRVKHAFVRVTAEIDGAEATGMCADHIFPKWFTKDPARTFDDEVAELLMVLKQAAAFAKEIEASTLFAFWKALYDKQLAWGAERGLEPLLTHFGVTLIERPLIDAYARAQGTTVADMVATNALGIDLGVIRGDLAGRQPAEFLPDKPLNTLKARHTVGLSDPLLESDIPKGEAVDDGLPQSLEACIRAYGLAHFKIKVCGDLERDIPRLRTLADVIGRLAPADYAFSLDGNEQFSTCAAFKAFWDEVLSDPALPAFFEHALFIEQPLGRKIALGDEVAQIKDWSGLPPIIIDESDAEIGSTPRALELGYAGTSHKNCKGVQRGIMNRCLINALGQETGQPERYLMSGEDLVNIGPVGVLQDLSLQAILGNETVERNGHHYFAGLDKFPPTTCERLLAAHPELYHVSASGWPTLTIINGTLDVRSLHAAPFSYGYAFPVEEYAWETL